MPSKFKEKIGDTIVEGVTESASKKLADIWENAKPTLIEIGVTAITFKVLWNLTGHIKPKISKTHIYLHLV